MDISSLQEGKLIISNHKNKEILKCENVFEHALVHFVDGLVLAFVLCNE